VVVTVSPTKINLPAGQSDPITLTLSFDPEALGGPGPDPGTPAIQGNQTPEPRHFHHQATGLVRFTQAGVGDVVLPYTGSVRAGVDRTGSAPSACDLSDAPDGPIAIELEGTGPHPDPVVTAFQLGGVDDPDPDSRNDRVTAMTDLLAAGVATDLATAPAFEEAQVYFGLAVSGPWSTPARGPVSVVKIQINSDDDPNYEHEIRVEARNPESRFRDALVASAYNLATGERSNRFPVNVLRPDVAQTHPFNSTVLVLSAQLVDIGVDSDNPVFDWTARTERPDLVVASDTIKGTFDAAKPAIDTARHGLDGAPVFRGEGPILVDVSPEAESPLDVLLLHHTNVPGKQWQVVTLSQKLSDNLSLTISAPEAESDGSGTAEVTLVVTNGGVAPVPDVKLAGDVNGGEIVSVAPGQGSCATGATLDCELGELAPGASVEVEATVRRLVIDATGPMQVTFEATVASELPCETDVEDNTASVTIDVSIPSENATGFYPSGGCTCRASGGTPGGAPSSAWLLVAAALGIARRGFRSSSARPAAGESA
jgi:hypothetical protein